MGLPGLSNNPSPTNQSPTLIHLHLRRVTRVLLIPRRVAVLVDLLLARLHILVPVRREPSPEVVVVLALDGIRGHVVSELEFLRLTFRGFGEVEVAHLEQEVVFVVGELAFKSLLEGC